MKNFLFFCLGVFLIGLLEVGCATTETHRSLPVALISPVVIDADYEAIKREHDDWSHCVMFHHVRDC